MKRFMAIVLCLVLAFSLAACGGTETTTEDATDTTEAAEKIKVAVVQQMDNGAFTDMREGFIARLREAGYTEDVCEVLEYNAQGDSTVLNTIISDVEAQHVDLIATIATPATLAAVGAELDIPTVFIAVSDPIGTGVIDDWDSITHNATGTSNPIPVDQIFELAATLTPEVETYGFVYSPSQANAVSTVESAKEYLDSVGIPYEEVTVTNSSEVQTAISTLGTKCDAFFIPNDSIIQDAMSVVTEYARENKIPVYGSSAVMPSSGALAAVAISDTEIGAQSADLAIRILNGEDITTVSSIAVEATETTINTTTAEALGIEIPEDIAATAIFVEDEN
ncbi:MAG: ABC transporter substrate-binding protein [Clostridia bacterium]|nr:ABC transporter substrate-binding protein [Clostridia bacterium]